MINNIFRLNCNPLIVDFILINPYNNTNKLQIRQIIVDSKNPISSFLYYAKSLLYLYFLVSMVSTEQLAFFSYFSVFSLCYMLDIKDLHTLKKTTSQSFNYTTLKKLTTNNNGKHIFNVLQSKLEPKDSILQNYLNNTKLQRNTYCSHSLIHNSSFNFLRQYLRCTTFGEKHLIKPYKLFNNHFIKYDKCKTFVIQHLVNSKKTILEKIEKDKLQGNLVLMLSQNKTTHALTSDIYLRYIIDELFSDIYFTLPITQQINNNICSENFLNEKYFLPGKVVLIDKKKINISKIYELSRLLGVKIVPNVLFFNLIIGLAVKSIVANNIKSVNMQCFQKFGFPIFKCSNRNNTLFLKKVMLNNTSVNIMIPLYKEINFHITCVGCNISLENSSNKLLKIPNNSDYKIKYVGYNNRPLEYIVSKEQVLKFQDISYSYNLLKKNITNIINNIPGKYFKKNKTQVKQFVYNYFNNIFWEKVLLPTNIHFNTDKKNC